MQAERVGAPPGPKYAHLEEAAGQRIRGVRRRGKFLLLPLQGGARPGDVLVIHLGMTGRLSARAPEGYERARLTFQEGPDPVLHFQDVRRFGRFLLLPGGDPAGLPTLAAMGPEPMSRAFDAAAFARSLQRSRTAVKTYLLSQRPVAGVGNIYADEALWRAGIHPATPARCVSGAQAAALRDAIRAVLRNAIRAQGTTLNDYRTVNGALGAYAAALSAYGHAGDACPRCGGTMERMVLGGRGTHLCPRCQPALAGPATPLGPSGRLTP